MEGETTYLDGTQRQAVDCPSCKMQRWIDVDCHHCGNSAVSCLKHHLNASMEVVKGFQAENAKLDKQWHEERAARLHYEELAGLYKDQRETLARELARAR